MVGQELPRLESLSVRSNRIGDQGARELFEALRHRHFRRRRSALGARAVAGWTWAGTRCKT